ncbi:MAG: hypothetical protein V1824_01220, partial [archaeon]
MIDETAISNNLETKRSFADKYQDFLNKINERIPIKALTSPLDKINPLMSFFVFIIIVLLVLVLVFKPYNLITQQQEQYTNLTIKLASNSGELLKNFPFQIKDLENDSLEEYTTDNLGKKEIELLKNGNYAIIVEKQGYNPLNQELDLSENENKFILEVFNLQTNVTKTLSFVDKTTNLAINQDLKVSIRCQNTDYTVEPSVADAQNGTFSLQVPTNCGAMLATVYNDNYYADSLTISEYQSTVAISPKDIVLQAGELKVIVKGSNGNYLDSINLLLYSEDDTINPIQNKPSMFGSSRFTNINFGNYKIVATDPSDNYLSNETSFTIDSELAKTIELTLTSLISPSPGSDLNQTTPDLNIATKIITVKLKDKDTGEEITDALFEPAIKWIKDSNTTLDPARSYTPGGTQFTFIVGQQYTLTASAIGYISKEKRNITSSDSEIVINLEKKTVSNVSDIKFKINDEDGLAITDATVLIYNDDYDSIDTRFEPVISDQNGSGSFSDIPQGNYYLKVKKVYLSGESAKFVHSPPVDSNLTIPVTIGQGTISLDIKNAFSDKIDNCEINFYNLDGTLVGKDYSDILGKYTKKLKADKIVYAVISKAGYLNYTTEYIPLYKDITISKEIILSREILGNVPQIEYLGVYERGASSKVDFLSQTKKYDFKFRVINPIAGNFGFIFKIGQEQDASKDIAYIKELLFTSGSTAYYEKAPYSTIITKGNKASLVDVYWSNLENGTIELTIPIQVDYATLKDIVPIGYKAYKYSATDGKYFTSPESGFISTKAEVISSEYNTKVYYIDTEKLCNTSFCFSGQYQNLDEDIKYDFTTSPAELVINGNYLFKYNLTTASNNSFSNNRLSISNLENVLDIREYDISGGGFLKSSQTDTTQAHNYNIPFIKDTFLTSEKINVNDKIKFNEKIITIKNGSAKLYHKLISDQSVAYEYNLPVVVNSKNPMTLSYSPTNIVPQIPFNLTINLKDNSGAFVEDAIVNIFAKKNGNLLTITSGKKTNSQGNLVISMPKLKNSETIVIEAYKNGYYLEPVTITINENVISAKYNSSEITIDSPLEININKNDISGITKSITLVNKTDYALVLNNFTSNDISFNNSQFLDLDKTLSNLNSQSNLGFTIAANSEKELNIKLAPSVDAAKLFESLEVKGVIKASVSNEEKTSNYLFNIPIKSLISVGSGVLENECLVVRSVPNTWQAVINGSGEATLNFVIQNNCISKDNKQPIALKNIKAKIVEDGDRFGSYNLTIDNSSVVLAEGIYKTIINEVEANSREYSAILKFNSGATKFGNLKTKIYLNAEVETKDGLKYVNTSKELILTNEIAVMQIADCFELYDSENKLINNMFVIDSDLIRGVDSKILNIKNKCSLNGNFRLTFCEDKTSISCQGLDYKNMSGEYENEIKFSIGTDSQAIEIIKPDVPGAYRIPIKIEALSQISGRSVATTYKQLKINVKDKLFMQDPFIEVGQVSSSSNYSSTVVELYNKDINLTPWDYATSNSKNSDGSGFGNLMNNNYKTDSPAYLNMKFTDIRKLGKTGSGNDWSGTKAGSLGTGIGAVTVLLGGDILPFLTLYLNPLGMGIGIALAVIVGVSSTFENEYSYDKYFNGVDIPSAYSMPDGEITKTINLSETNELDSTDSKQLISVFDITGARYKTFLNAYGHGHGKLANDETLKMTVPKCDGAEHKIAFDEYHYVANSRNCSDSIGFTNGTADYTYKVSCNGSWPRKRIDLKTQAYTTCVYDNTIWPHQAGIKPVQIVLEKGSDIENTIDKLSDNVYKTINFYPTYDDSKEITTPDPAFANANEIGKFRFEIHKKEIATRENADLEIYSCSTDSQKLGKTGPGMVPDVLLNWDWELGDITKCSEKYCDATNLTQVIVNRIDKANSIINDSSKGRSIFCPNSTSQILDNAMNGKYTYSAEPDGIENEIPIGEVGISKVSFATENKSFKIKVILENRTIENISVNGNLAINLPGQKLESKTEIDSSGNFVDTNISTIGSYSLPVTVPSGEEDNFKEVIFTYGSDINPIDVNDPIDLIITFDKGNNYRTFNSKITIGTYKSANNTSCQVPSTTARFNGIDYIDYWLDNTQYPSNVRS